MPTRPNILWYCAGQQRYDTIRALGYDCETWLRHEKKVDPVARELKLERTKAQLDAMMATVSAGPPRSVAY